MHHISLKAISLKFVEHYNERNRKAQLKTPYVCKAAPSVNLGRHRNIDNTDSSSDNEDYQQVINKGNMYLDEQSLYLNTHEVVPDDMRIVQWWRVRCIVVP